MKVSAVIDKNTISGTILLDEIIQLNIKLLHEMDYNGVKKYIILDSVTVQPSNKYFDYNFLNPIYYNNLIIEVNNVKHSVLEPEIEYTDESNPTNDRIYVQSELPDLSEVVVSEEPMHNDFQDFGVKLSHSAISNLVDIKNFTSQQHMLNDENGIRFDIQEDTIVSTKFILNFAPEITISIDGTKPDQIRLYLINSRGEERLITNFWEYSSYDASNYSSSLTSSTKNARIELVYLKDKFNFKSVRIKNITVGIVSQYFGKSLASRFVDSVQVNINKSVLYVFKSDFFPMFGLRTLMILGDNINGHTIQISNGKVLFKKVGSSISSVLTTDLVSLPLEVGVYISDTNTKIYINSVEIKSVSDNLLIPSGIYTAYVGASNVDQDFDSNAQISFSVYNRNLYE